MAYGLLGALSFTTAGTLAAGLFPGDARRSALAIAILFGTGGGVGVVLTGWGMPLMLDAWGPASWPVGWLVICAALPVVLPKGLVLLVSAVVFGLAVFMAPGAGTNFVRQNLPPQAWGRAISLMTLVFAVAQIAGPCGAGLVADFFESIGVSLLAAAGLLLRGAGLALLQRPLHR